MFKVPLVDTPFGPAFQHDLDGSHGIIFLARHRDGFRGVGGGVLMPSQAYSMRVEAYLEDNPDTLEVVILDMATGEKVSVWEAESS